MAYGSGDLGPWSNLTHNIVGDWSTAHTGLIGDSITTLSWSTFRATLGYNALAVNYWSGRPMRDAVAWLKAQPVLPETLYVACGTNDIFDPPRFQADLRELIAHLESLGGNRRLVLVTVQARRTGQPVAVQWCDQMNSAWVNKFIYEEAATRRWISVAQWSELFQADKNRLSRYLADGVHPTTSGSYVGTAAWANILVSALAPAVPVNG
jgi:lysophospholipase L1-like esterase